MSAAQEKPVEVMKGIVFGHMKEQEKTGQLSKAHSYDHVENVARYAGVFAGYLARKLNVGSEKAVIFARMAGLSHDIVRYAAEGGKSGEEESAALLSSIYDDYFSNLVTRDDYERLIVGVVRNSKNGFTEMQQIYANDHEARAVALALVAGDKLIEASGPRVLERRPFFVGGERMRNKKDLGAALGFPHESHLGVLSETFVRLGDINHVGGYASDPSLLKLAQELHKYQYQFYKGLLLLTGMTETEALEYIGKRFEEKLPKINAAVQKGGKRLIEEHHLDGTYFEHNNMPVLLQAVREMPDDLRDSSKELVRIFAEADSPDAAIDKYLFHQRRSGPLTFDRWMNDIIEYRNGRFTARILESLET